MTDNEIKLAINKTINASVEKVFQAWTNAEILAQWFGHETMVVAETRADPRVGGEYMIHLQNQETGSDHIVSGTYEEIVENEKLVFNWMWKDGVDRSQVTVDFRPADDGQTLLTLTHRGFSDTEYRDLHNQGWTACLESLVNHFG